jgi:Core-2/I-Branching enzyme
MNIETEFPARYWINLARRQDRRFETEYQLERAGFTAERFPAVDARYVKKTRGYASAGRYALALSQRLAIRKAMQQGAAAVLVLEDDVIFHPEFDERLAEIELPEDWGIFYLGCAHQKRPRPVGSGLVRATYALDTHAFAVKAPYYRQVMAALSRRENEIEHHARASDWFLADLHEEIPTYACFPNLAWQAANHSDLMDGTYSNYTASGEQISATAEHCGLQAEAWGGTRWNGWLEPIPVVHEPKIGLLFLTRGDVNQPEIWRQFVNQAVGEIKIFCHAKNQENIQGSFLEGTHIDECLETRWGDISLVRAMLALLKAGLQDESLTHFVFLSESCIPIKPWAEIRRRLRFDSRSMAFLQNSTEMKV